MSRPLYCLAMICARTLCCRITCLPLSFFFFNDTATTEIYTLSLHDALPIFRRRRSSSTRPRATTESTTPKPVQRSEEHTSELQSLTNLVCRLLLEKKKKKKKNNLAKRKENQRPNCVVLAPGHKYVHLRLE